MSTKVTTKKVRFSFANVFQPKAMSEGQPKKYSVALLIDKDDEVTLKRIKDAIEEAKELGKSKWGNKIPKNLKIPLRDGDSESDSEAYEGKMFINANSSNRPGVVDRDLSAILEEDDEFYSGCYGRAGINFYAFDVNGNKGIACGLNNVQKLADGDRLSGGTSAAEDFEEDFEEDDMLD